MGRHFHTYGIFLAAGIVVAACGSVSGNDPAFWQRSHNLGGPGAGAAGPGAGGSSTGSGGSSSGSGGSSSGSGGSSSGGSSSGSGGSSSGSGGSSSGSGGSSSGSGGSSSGSGGSGGGGPSLCQFTFDVTTTDYGGSYSPRNVEATWIEGPSNQFIKTLEVHAATRSIHLVNWNKSSNGNKVDAITSATLYSQPQTHHVTWNCTDTSGKPVPPGAYHVYFEFTSDDSAYPFFPKPQEGHVDFQVGKSATMSPPNQGHFTNMHLTIK